MELRLSNFHSPEIGERHSQLVISVLNLAKPVLMLFFYYASAVLYCFFFTPGS